MNKSDSPQSLLFFLGKDREGHWIARDQSGLRGGLFVDHEKALKFALSENGNQPQAVITLSGILDLDFNSNASPANHLIIISRTASPVRKANATSPTAYPRTTSAR